MNRIRRGRLNHNNTIPIDTNMWFNKEITPNNTIFCSSVKTILMKYFEKSII